MIRNKRLQKNMTQQEVADCIGVDRTTVAKWESGTAFPTANKLPKLAKTLGCTIDDLFEDRA